MRAELATVLRLVAEGKLSADEAAPIIEALTIGGGGADQSRPAAAEPSGTARGRKGRIQVSERGRRTIDIRVPLAFATVAARMVPGIPDRYAEMIERAVDSETAGTIVDTEDEDGDRVLITVE